MTSPSFQSKTLGESVVPLSIHWRVRCQTETKTVLYIGNICWLAFILNSWITWWIMDMIWYDMVWYDMIWYKICDMWYMIYDIWYVICDMWYVIYDMWYMICDMIWFDMIMIWYDMCWCWTWCRSLLYIPAVPAANWIFQESRVDINSSFILFFFYTLGIQGELWPNMTYESCTAGL